MARHSRQGARARGARFIVRPLFAALVASGLAAPTGLQAATIQVATGGDAGTGATCTLRQAIVALNTASLVGTACINSGGGFGASDQVDLTLQAGTITLAGGAEIPVDVSMVINGPGAGALTVSGAGASRVFGSTSSPPGLAVDINGLTVANGVSAGPGGCILGGGVVRLLNTVVTGCTAIHSSTFAAPYLNGVGGGVAAYDVRLTTSTVTGNTAQTAGGGVFAKYATADHSLVSNNTVTGQACNYDTYGKYCTTAFFGGGGMAVGSAQVIHSTVSGNTVSASALTKYNSSTQTLQTYNVGLGGGITQLNKYGYYYEGFSASKAVKSTIFGPRSTEARAARRAAWAAAKAQAQLKSRAGVTGARAGVTGARAGVTGARAGVTGGARTKADGYGYYILALNSSTISGNRIIGNGLHDGKYFGGGALAVSKYYNAEIANSTISGNTLGQSAEFPVGGGLFTDSAEIYNSTISNNNGYYAVAFVGGIVTASTAKGAIGAKTGKAARAAKVVAFAAAAQAKLAALRGARGKAAVNKASAPPVLVSTIVGGNPSDYDVACFVTNCTIQGSNNLIQKNDPNITFPGDTIFANPELTPLANHGGELAGAPGHGQTAPTPTHLLFFGSPAIDRGYNYEGFPYDQRGTGFPRIVGVQADIGATEGAIGKDVPVPAVGPWLVAALSALLGILGLRRRRRAA